MRSPRNTALQLFGLTLATMVCVAALTPTTYVLAHPPEVNPSWTLTGSLNTARYNHTATLLPNGKVLVVAGWHWPSPLSSAEMYYRIGAERPEAEKEVKTLEQLYSSAQSRVYTGAEAQEGRAKSEAGKYRIIHFATHGILNDASPMYSYLVLSKAEGDAVEDGLFEAWEIMNLSLRADLVVLSACDTARGRIGAGEGVMGLSWAFFVAGAPDHTGQPVESGIGEHRATDARISSQLSIEARDSKAEAGGG